MKKKYLYIVFFALTISSCEEFVTVNQTETLSKESVFSKPEYAESAVFGLYTRVRGAGFYGRKKQLDVALMADELTTFTPDLVAFAQNNVIPTSLVHGSLWSSSYDIINVANSLIDNLPIVPKIKDSQLAEWAAEAKFIRAFTYFHLIQLFGDVPKIVNSNWEVNQRLPRSPRAEIIELITADLIEAESTLPDEYETELLTHVRATRTAAKAMLCKLYVLTRDWQNAELKATEVISNPDYVIMSDFASVFAQASGETIFELNFDANNPASIYLFFGGGRGAANKATTKLNTAFAPGDVRKPVSLGSSLTVVKYKTSTDPIKLIRLADIYLLRAEARAHLDDVTGAAEDVNVIRKRAGLPNTAAADQSSMLLAIENERFVELAFEGHRWFDLVRTGRADEVLKVLKPNSWQPTDLLLPVPQAEINANKNLLPQNAPF